MRGNADPTIEAEDGSTALSIAKAEGRTVLTSLLVEGYVTFGINNDNHEVILHAIENEGAHVDTKTGSGWTPLILAASQGNLEFATKLIDLGADLNLAEYDGWTPLHFAAGSGFISVIDLLLERGADPNIMNNDQKTPRDIAEDFNHGDAASVIANAPAGDDL